MLWMRKNSGLKGRARERRSELKAKSRTSARRAVLKGIGLTLHLRRWARRVSKTFAHALAHPGETTTRNRDTSISAGSRFAEPARSHDGAVTLVMSAETPAHMTTPTSPLQP
jgi:hypothetical protein